MKRLFASLIFLLTSAAFATSAHADAPSTAAHDLPVIVAVMADARVTPATVEAIRGVALSGAEGIANGRRVVALTDTAALTALAACSDAACVGTQIANAHGAAGVIVRISRRARMEAKIEIVDAVTGAPRHDAVVVSDNNLANALGPAIAALRAAMPAAPAPAATLLITVSLDGAVVTVDGQSAGVSPLAAISLPAGMHTISAAHSGYETLTHTAQIPETGNARLDFDLVPTAETRERLDATRSVALPMGGSEEVANADSSEPWYARTTGPWYTRWYTLAGGAAGVVILAVIIGVASSNHGTNVLPPVGAIPVTPIQ